MNCEWVFEPTPLMGGATGEAYTNPLLGTGMEPEAVLAREAIQNSSDAQDNVKKVRVVFRRVSLIGREKRDFIKVLQLSPAMTSRKGLKLPKAACLSTLHDSDRPLELLYVEDYGTYGLFGNPLSPKSHFFRLLLSLGDGAKAREASGSGGSYGFGKSVYSSNSRIHTVVAYSVIDPKRSGREGRRDHARLMGCAYFNAHEHVGTDFSGRAWFGIPKKNDAAEPLLDDDAHALALKLGFEPRAAEDLGTSLLIVDCGVESDQLRESIEDWWWPRLVDGEIGLDVMMYEDGKLLPPPRPKRRPDLRPFLECFDMAIGRSAPTGNHQKQGSLNRLHDKPLGDFGFVVLSENITTEDEKLSERLGTVALIRKPRMVIEYMSVGTGLPLPCVGVFLADEGIDDYLKRSEPASHDKWDPKSSRLSELPDEAREIVGIVLRRVKGGLRKFANDAAPKAPEQDMRLRALEKLLGGIFQPPSLTPYPPPPPGTDPISINFIQQPHPVPAKDKIATKGAFKVSLSENAERESVKVSVKVSCYVLEDESISREDPVSVHVESGDLNGGGKRLPDGSVVFDLGREDAPTFKFKTEPYDKDWSTSVRVEVQEVQ